MTNRPDEPPDNILGYTESEGAALMLATQIEGYWRDAGFLGVRVIVTRRGQRFDIRSNVGPSGYPPRRRNADG